ncbi:MAG: hypothetical protein R3308_08655, partial [Thiohalobacterales bacterium]|nr:hypothetical protein [Thiohalobacterales bacterium]
MRYTQVSLLALVFALGAAAPAHADTPPADTPAQTVQSETETADAEKIGKILEKTTTASETLDALRGDITKLNADLQKATDEDLAVLRDQRRRKYAELRDELERFVDRLMELEAAGEETSETRQQAVASTGQVSGWLKEEVKASLALLTGLEEQIKTA